MVWQARACASAEIHTDIEAVGFYRQRQGFLRFQDELEQLQHFFAACLFKVGDMSDRGEQ